MGEVEFQAVHKSFGSVRAVDGISFEVKQGEFLALLGPSGCGKTTSLRLIAGLLQPDDGEILIQGRSMVGVPPNKRDVGIVFQNYALFPHMTVASNVAFGLQMRKVPKGEIGRRVSEALELVQLKGYEERWPHQLSGGQQQRVALARALVIQPAVLLLDEPLAALDKRLRMNMQVELKTLQRRVGITTVFVTHDQEEALTLSDRIAVMNAGRIEQLAPPQEIYDRPATRFVLEFIGRANVLTGEVAADNGRQTFRSGELAFALGNGSTDLPSGRAILAVRPERVRLCPCPPEGCENVVTAEVSNSVYMGSHVHYYVRLPSGDEFLAMEAAATGPVMQVGDQVWVTWDAKAARVLSA